MSMGRTARGPAAVICAVLALAACGPGEEDDPEGAAARVWDRFRGYVGQLETARGPARDEPRRRVCYRLATPLRTRLAKTAGAEDLPQCPFLERVELLNGSRTLGPLRDVRVPDQPGPLTVRARFRADDALEDVEIQEVNPGNWEITRLAGLP